MLPHNGGREVVDETLQVAGHPNVFVAGDFAAVPGNQPDAGLAVLAPVTHPGRQPGRPLMAGKPLAGFRYRDK